VQRIVLALDDLGVRLAGPLGRDLPEIDADHISFNGPWAAYVIPVAMLTSRDLSAINSRLATIQLLG
jgi:hypothetical protein